MKTRIVNSLVILVTALMLVGGLLFLLWPVRRPPPREQLNALVQDGDAIIRALERHRAQHNRYPPDIPHDLPLARADQFGGWKYSCVADCTSFKLNVGRYADSAFHISWLPDENRWYIDT
jgi:hypothetical protein